MVIDYNMSFEDIKDDISILTYNWNLVRICYEIWENDIIGYWKDNKELYEIAGVGKNYIGEICAGRVKNTKRRFNSEDYGDLIYYLRGESKIIDLPVLAKFIVLNNVYNDINTCKRRKQDYSEISKWIQGNVGKNAVCKEGIDTLKEKVIQGIRNASLVTGATGTPTPLGNLKNYLMGKEHKEVVANEIQNYIVRLLRLVMDIKCEKLSSLSDKQLGVCMRYAKMLYDRFYIESEGRRIKNEESELFGKVHDAMLQKQQEDIRREEAEYLEKN